MNATDLTANLTALVQQVQLLSDQLTALTATERDTIDEQQAKIDDLTNALTSFWLLSNGFLVFIMQLGFTLLEVGGVRATNSKNVIMQNILTTCIAATMWWFLGYGIFEGRSTDGVGGMRELVTDKAPQLATFMFFWGFDAAATTIVSGAVTSRIKFSGYICSCVVISGFVFPFVAYWLWGNGFMGPVSTHNLVMIDFAGGLPVHTVGGVFALVGTIVVGPRTGRFTKNEQGEWQDNKEPGHSIILSTIGVMLLWFGWYGFNSGSCLSLAGGRYLLANRAAVNSLIAASAGGLSITIYFVYRKNVHDLMEFLNGILCGLVAITPCAGTVPVWAAFVIGATSVFPYIFGAHMLARLRIDDVMDAFPVHGMCGIYGTLCAGVFSTQEYIDEAFGAGLIKYDPGYQLGVQLLGAVIVVTFTATTAAALFLTLKYTVGLRVSESDERVGLDFKYHAGYAYPDFNQRVKRAHEQMALEAEIAAQVRKHINQGKGGRFKDAINAAPTHMQAPVQKPGTQNEFQSSVGSEEDAAGDVGMSTTRQKTGRLVAAPTAHTQRRMTNPGGTATNTTTNGYLGASLVRESQPRIAPVSKSIPVEFCASPSSALHTENADGGANGAGAGANGGGAGLGVRSSASVGGHLTTYSSLPSQLGHGSANGAANGSSGAAAGGTGSNAAYLTSPSQHFHSHLHHAHGPIASSASLHRLGGPSNSALASVGSGAVAGTSTVVLVGGAPPSASSAGGAFSASMSSSVMSSSSSSSMSSSSSSVVPAVTSTTSAASGTTAGGTSADAVGPAGPSGAGAASSSSSPADQHGGGSHLPTAPSHFASSHHVMSHFVSSGSSNNSISSNGSSISVSSNVGAAMRGGGGGGGADVVGNNVSTTNSPSQHGHSNGTIGSTNPTRMSGGSGSVASTSTFTQLPPRVPTASTNGLFVAASSINGGAPITPSATEVVHGRTSSRLSTTTLPPGVVAAVASSSSSSTAALASSTSSASSASSSSSSAAAATGPTLSATASMGSLVPVPPSSPPPSVARTAIKHQQSASVPPPSNNSLSLSVITPALNSKLRQEQRSSFGGVGGGGGGGSNGGGSNGSGVNGGSNGGSHAGGSSSSLHPTVSSPLANALRGLSSHSLDSPTSLSLPHAPDV